MYVNRHDPVHRSASATSSCSCDLLRRQLRRPSPLALRHKKKSALTDCPVRRNRKRRHPPPMGGVVRISGDN